MTPRHAERCPARDACHQLSDLGNLTESYYLGEKLEDDRREKRNNEGVNIDGIQNRKYISLQPPQTPNLC